MHEVMHDMQSACIFTVAGCSPAALRVPWTIGRRLAAPEMRVASSRCLRRVASYVFAGTIWGRRPEAIAAENGEATLLGTPVSRYKEVVLFVIKDFTGCVTLIGSTTLGVPVQL